MPAEKRSFPGLIWPLRGAVFAAVMLAAMPLPLAAEEVSVTQSDFFSEAGVAPLYFTVNPDGSVSCFYTGVNCLTATSAPADWDLDVTGQIGFPEGSLGALDFPALPPGSTITSATFSWSVGETIIPFPSSPEFQVLFNVVGSLGLQSVDGPCGIAVPSDSGTCSFTPGSTDETFYYPDFSGGGDAMLVAVIPDEPGGYIGGADIGVSATYTITEDFSPAPEPRICGFLVGLGMVGFFAIRRSPAGKPHAAVSLND